MHYYCCCLWNLFDDSNAEYWKNIYLIEAFISLVISAIIIVIDADVAIVFVIIVYLWTAE